MNTNNKYHEYLKTLKRTELSNLCKKYIIQTKIVQANKKKEHLIQSLLLHTELDINGNIKTKQWSIMSNQKPQIIATVKKPTVKPTVKKPTVKQPTVKPTVKQPTKTIEKITENKKLNKKIIYQDPIYKTDDKGWETKHAPNYDLNKYRQTYIPAKGKYLLTEI
jgi:hypothetical protein